VGLADKSSGALVSVDCSLSISDNRIKFVVSKNGNDYTFRFEEVPMKETNLFCTKADDGNPTFTIEYVTSKNGTNKVLSFIGTEDVRTGRSELRFPIDDGELPDGIFLKYDTGQERLFINA
jgi:hypothetical protein